MNLRYLCHRRKTPIHSLLTPCRPHKSGCWGWNTSLPRNEVPSHPVLGLSPCVGISFPVLGSLCVSLFYLSMCIIWHPHYYIHPFGKEVGSFIVQRKRGCVQASSPASAARRESLVIGIWFLLLKLIQLCLLSVSKMLFQSEFLCVKGQDTTE